MQNVDYSFVSTEPNTIVVRSKVQSFGLENITDKDSISFFMNFSKESYFDSGLLPVDGTGLISIRKALNHVQICYQVKPGLYYVNWGQSEGDPNAQKYLLAQPYKVIIGDIVNDNFLGARTFYSPYPVTHPDTLLYHVNLPNINCRGYRGTGVGWNCLYHNQDISNLPLNEKISNIVQRCSGVEAYNDANMSETDGPRFYADHYNNDNSYAYLWNPVLWESLSQENGFEWTLNPDIWIPVKVESIDSQSQHSHDNNAVNLTLYMALFGSYNAYYSDPYFVKPVNALSRADLDVNPKDFFTSFIRSYNSSQATFLKVDIAHQIKEHREQLSHSHAPQIFDEDDSEEDNVPCHDCGSPVPESNAYVVNDYLTCEDCFSSNYVYLENEGDYFLSDDERVVFSEIDECYYNIESLSEDSYSTCPRCSSVHVYHTYSPYASPIYLKYSLPSEEDRCSFCLAPSEATQCGICKTRIPSSSDYNVPSATYYDHLGKHTHKICHLCNFINVNKIYGNSLIDVETPVTCICGLTRPMSEFRYKIHNSVYRNVFKGDTTLFLPEVYETLNNSPTLFASFKDWKDHCGSDAPIKISLTAACTTCLDEANNSSSPHEFWMHHALKIPDLINTYVSDPDLNLEQIASFNYRYTEQF